MFFAIFSLIVCSFVAFIVLRVYKLKGIAIFLPMLFPVIFAVVGIQSADHELMACSFWALGPSIGLTFLLAFAEELD